jgi:hypothetical protein
MPVFFNYSKKIKLKSYFNIYIIFSIRTMLLLDVKNFIILSPIILIINSFTTKNYRLINRILTSKYF